MSLFLPVLLDLSKAWWLVVILACTLAFVMSKISFVDLPNERSSHTKPTPKGGGVAFVIPALFLFLALSSSDPVVFFLFLPSFLIAFMGFFDDYLNLSWRFRFVCQLALCLWVMIALLTFLTPFSTLEGGYRWIFLLFGSFWLLYITNIYNFMDGIDGLTAIESILVCAFFMPFAIQISSFSAYMFSYYLLFGTLGFLMFNFPKAKLFMGDVGSQFLGFILGTLGLLLMANNKDYFFVMPLLLFNFIFDGGWTLLMRFIKKENIFKAHKSHLYQQLVQAGWAHWQVALLNGGFVVFQGMLLLWGEFLGEIKGLAGLWLFIPAILLQSIYLIFVYSKKSKG